MKPTAIPAIKPKGQPPVYKQFDVTLSRTGQLYISPKCYHLKVRPYRWVSVVYRPESRIMLLHLHRREADGRWRISEPTRGYQVTLKYVLRQFGVTLTSAVRTDVLKINETTLQFQIPKGNVKT
jgi:hypothetical protein